GYQSIEDLVAPEGRLCKQRDIAHAMLTAIPGVSCTKPAAAMYLFPKLDPAIYPIEDDQQFILDLLLEEKVLLVQGTGFNWKSPDHFRVVFLPNVDDLTEAINRIARFLESYRNKHGKNSMQAKVQNKSAIKTSTQKIDLEQKFETT
ncbi:MAG TPA: aminotransferase class I/II-fold pyridoxal phosphate-dependent enzyme, partial [Methylotenera sp.]|nr:aminotransferase class I/II-fold pyridoxal phosphate-dependent enzyme [Methylotenera sp.]